MKRMTKEELIEYFMEQLEDNDVFGQAMTTDRIREKLNKYIARVTFEPESFGQGSYYFYRVEDNDRVWGNLNLDLDKLNKVDEDSQKMLINRL